MLCFKCHTYNLILDFENYIVLNKPNLYDEFNQIINDYFILSENEQTCDNCNSLILENMLYVEEVDGFYESLFELISKEIMRGIVACTECGEGANIQSFYPSIKSCFYDKQDNPTKIFESIDTSSEIKDLMYEILQNNNDSWEQYYENIVEYIQCPNCENGSGEDMDEHIDHGKFNLYTEVYTQADIDEFNRNFYGDSIDKINEEVSQIAKEFTINELVELRSKFSSNKLFIHAHPSFSKLYDLIKTSCIVYILSTDRIVFRARPTKDSYVFQKDEMWDAPRARVGQGRYNDNGEVVLYCSNSKDAVKKEVVSNTGEYTIGVFQVNEPMVLLPVNYLFGRDFEGFISEIVNPDESSYKSKEQYIITNIVSAIAKEIGYKGIVYISTKDKFSVNYALFNYEKNVDLTCIHTYWC